MKAFQKKDGGIIQLIDKEKMNDWPVELPFLFVEYIREKKLDTYGDTKVKKEVEAYLDEIMKDIAIPRLIILLESENDEEIILSLTRIEEIAKKNIDMAKPIQKYLRDLQSNKNKKIVELSNKISDIFVKAERKKELAKKRKIMQEKEKEFLAGKISAEEYIKVRKEYLLLKE
ncbi:MAG: hypothetical protein ACFE85_04445 [Candidatus Hodarchaeota archaeon]